MINCAFAESFKSGINSRPLRDENVILTGWV
jgi:hypothetical protein